MTAPLHSQSSLIREVFRLLRWDKPAGRLILMIPALWALCLATQARPPLGLLLVIVAGSLATSAAGCVVNDLWDRNIDPQVERTKRRPLAAKTLTIRVGIGAALLCFLCALGLALYLTPLSFGLCVAAVPVIVLYPLAKRVFPIPQLVLSIAWGFAVLISWSAAANEITLSTWLLWGATLLWTLGFDTVYAMPDRSDDRRLGVNSSALFFGPHASLAVGLCYLGTFGLLIGLGLREELHWVFWITLAIGGFYWGRQSLALRHDPLPIHRYADFFRQNVTLGFVLLLGMVGGKWI
ncbi:4-hydroxybenzoate solanesyltransferase [Lyngbya confervoides]|uniref:4-hydroxybenzoate solanesyltransferase n=1 Tax=Lyngbya confervoides BDU141951 TaxID=1574623 RepID=A0ABD4T3H8_9CYAN|nr:4-hydroxybenzoate solanesyltransferase [Lyngbya confervoides]MCM1982980.1 4-hydroxybenzoate solanesyltransferase [Lyngbya confervoides BDU141951]